MLSCSCDFDDYDWWYIGTDELSTLDTKRSKRCQSCKKLIPVESTVIKFHCFRSPRSDYEERRFGVEIPLADKYYCESCAEIYLNLSQVFECITMGDMREALREYWEMTGFDPSKYTEVRNGKA